MSQEILPFQQNKNTKLRQNFKIALKSGIVRTIKLSHSFVTRLFHPLIFSLDDMKLQRRFGTCWPLATQLLTWLISVSDSKRPQTSKTRVWSINSWFSFSDAVTLGSISLVWTNMEVYRGCHTLSSLSRSTSYTISYGSSSEFWASSSLASSSCSFTFTWECSLRTYLRGNST